MQDHEAQKTPIVADIKDNGLLLVYILKILEAHQASHKDRSKIRLVSVTGSSSYVMKPVEHLERNVRS